MFESFSLKPLSNNIQFRRLTLASFPKIMEKLTSYLQKSCTSKISPILTFVSDPHFLSSHRHTEPLTTSMSKMSYLVLLQPTHNGTWVLNKWTHDGLHLLLEYSRAQDQDMWLKKDWMIPCRKRDRLLCPTRPKYKIIKSFFFDRSRLPSRLEAWKSPKSQRNGRISFLARSTRLQSRISEWWNSPTAVNIFKCGLLWWGAGDHNMSSIIWWGQRSANSRITFTDTCQHGASQGRAYEDLIRVCVRKSACCIS